MLMLDADTVLNSLPYTTLVDELAELHREPVCLVEDMLMESKDKNDNANHFFIRCGWQPEKAVGAKVITVFPRNNIEGDWPSIQAVYLLFEGVNGTPIACLDGTALTWLKTAADSALGGKLLARDDIRHMLMIGAGQMAPHLVRAHCQVQPSLETVQIWNRSVEKAELLCTLLADDFPGVRFTSTTDIEAAARASDLICSAVPSLQPMIRGDWLSPGVHLDLVGAYTSEMREADDQCLLRGSLFVDARQTTINHTGELMIPLTSGVIEEDDVLADFVDLCQQRHPGRNSDDEITIFKNGGGGHLDLMCARLIYEQLHNL